MKTNLSSSLRLSLNKTKEKFIKRFDDSYSILIIYKSKSYLFFKLVTRIRLIFFSKKLISGRLTSSGDDVSSCFNSLFGFLLFVIFLFCLSSFVDADEDRSSVENTRINSKLYLRKILYYLHLISFSVNGIPKSRFNDVIISIVGNKLYRADELNLCT